MDFRIRNPANYQILESGPFEIWNTPSWNRESSIWNAGCGAWNLGSKIVSDLLRRLKVSAYISYFQVSCLEQANVFQTLEYFFR